MRQLNVISYSLIFWAFLVRLSYAAPPIIESTRQVTVINSAFDASNYSVPTPTKDIKTALTCNISNSSQADQIVTISYFGHIGNTNNSNGSLINSNHAADIDPPGPLAGTGAGRTFISPESNLVADIVLKPGASYLAQWKNGGSAGPTVVGSLPRMIKFSVKGNAGYLMGSCQVTSTPSGVSFSLPVNGGKPF